LTYRIISTPTDNQTYYVVPVAISTRRIENNELLLQDKLRPKYMAKWDIPHPRNPEG
jgi:hypothetical protein